jgi:hypothetical protein
MEKCRYCAGAKTEPSTNHGAAMAEKHGAPCRLRRYPITIQEQMPVTLKDGRQLIVYNHVKPAEGLTNGKGARTPLNVAISNDGKNWAGRIDTGRIRLSANILIHPLFKQKTAWCTSFIPGDGSG